MVVKFLTIWEGTRDVWNLQQHFDALTIWYERPTIFNDNLAVISIIGLLKPVPGAKSIFYHCLRVREHFVYGNIADILTKVLPTDQHRFLTSELITPKNKDKDANEGE